MDIDWETVFATGTTTATLVAIVFLFSLYLGKQGLKGILDKEIEKFKHALRIDETTRTLMLKSDIDFKERQLSEFYGPIYARLKRGKPLYDLWRKGIVDEIDTHIRNLFVESNKTIVDIIINKSHLIEGEEIPASFIDYIGHVELWHGYLDTVSLSFSSDDINNVGNLVKKIRNGTDTLSLYINNHLSMEIKTLFEKKETLSEQEENTFIEKGLNKLLEDSELYDAIRFNKVKLREKTRTLISKNPEGDDLIRLNRLLLEDAYPQEIIKEQKGIPFTKDVCPMAYYPDEFEEDIILTTETLKRNLHKLHQQYGLLA